MCDDGASDAMEGESRIRQRIDACRVGIIKLDALRVKHQRLMHEMRAQLGLSMPAGESSSGRASTSVDASVVGAEVRGVAAARCTSPAPSFAELSSSMSHRSSISMDSGCLSMLSDPPSQHRKLSRDTLLTPISFDAASEDEGCFADAKPLIQNAIDSATATLDSRCRYQKNPRTSPQRAANAPCYPLENTVLVSAEARATVHGPKAAFTATIARSHSVQLRRPLVAASVVDVGAADKTFRASRVFVEPTVSPKAVRAPRPKSIALYPTGGGCRSPRSNRRLVANAAKPTTWEDVKRMLDPDFEQRAAAAPGSLSRQQSAASSTHTLTPTEVRKFKVVKASPSAPPLGCSSVFVASSAAKQEHDDLSRSLSSLSSDSSKSSRRPPKEWHESESL